MDRSTKKDAATSIAASDQAAKTSELSAETVAVTTVKAFPVRLSEVTKASILEVVRSFRIKAATVLRIVGPSIHSVLVTLAISSRTLNLYTKAASLKMLGKIGRKVGPWFSGTRYKVLYDQPKPQKH